MVRLLNRTPLQAYLIYKMQLHAYSIIFKIIMFSYFLSMCSKHDTTCRYFVSGPREKFISRFVQACSRTPQKSPILHPKERVVHVN